MSPTIHYKYKYFDSTVQRAEHRLEKFYFCRLSFAVNVKLNLSNISFVLRLIFDLFLDRIMLLSGRKNADDN